MSEHISDSALRRDLERRRATAWMWSQRHGAVEDFADWLEMADDDLKREFWMGVSADSMEARYELGTFIGHVDAVLAQFETVPR
jgi:hypothetical protein